MIYINGFQVLPTSTFKKELENIVFYSENRLKEPFTAKKFYNKVTRKIYSLQFLPERYISLSNYKDKNRNLRRLLIDNYVIIYEVSNDTRTSFYSTYFP